jgi:hypothetical protein
MESQNNELRWFERLADILGVMNCSHAQTLLVVLGTQLYCGCTKGDEAPCSEGFERLGAERCEPIQTSGDSGNGDSTPPDDGPVDTGPVDTGVPEPTPTDIGWQLGEVAPCIEPVSEISYTDESLAIASTEPWSRHSEVHYGPMGVAQDSTGAWAGIWHTPSGYQWSLLDGSRQGTISSTMNPRLIVVDLDQDGEMDVILFSGSIEVVWSFLEEDSSTDTLFAPMEGDECGWLEIVVGDFDGDTTLDIMAPTGFGCAPPVMPDLATQVVPRVFDRIVYSTDAETGSTLDSVSIDLNGDGALDVYLCNDFGPEVEPNQWAINQGDGSFLIEDALGSGVTTYCMSTSFGDLNQDGTLDMMVVGIGQQFGFVRMGESYVDHWASWGLPVLLTSDDMPWGSAVTDLDNDGRTDILLTASGFSYVNDVDGEPDDAHLQLAEGEFSDQSESLGFPQTGNTRGLITRDVNRDGVLDVLIADYRRSPWVFMSEGCTANNWIEIEAPIGTVVRVEAGEHSWSGLVSNHQGFSGFGPASVHVGLGDIEQVDRVIATVPWVGEVSINEPFTVPRVVQWSPGSDSVE